MRFNLTKAQTLRSTGWPQFSMLSNHKLDVILAHCQTKHLQQEFYLSCWLLLQFRLQGPPSPTKYSKAFSHTSVTSSVLKNLMMI